MAKKVELYLGTRKGAFVAESDSSRRKWKVRGPYHGGGDVYHAAPDPRHPGAAYALVNSPWFGPSIHRSTDHGKHWKEVGLPVLLNAKPVEHMGRAKDKPTAIVNLWHLEPGPENEAKSLYLGIDPASLFRSDDLGNTWTGLPGLNEHPTREKWGPGAGGMCLHTIIQDPSNPRRMFIGISAAGTFRSMDGGDHWEPCNKGVFVEFLPERNPEIGQCVHHVEPSPDFTTFYRQDHSGIFVSNDQMDSWTHVGKGLPSDFGFVVATTSSDPGAAFFAPLEPITRAMVGGSFQTYRWTAKDRKWKATVNPKKWPGQFGTHRDAMAADELHPAGVYVGTTSGNLFFSRDASKSWDMIPFQFPGIHSVEVAVT